MNWSEWEDFNAGMYYSTYTPTHVAAARDLLADPDAFFETAREMVREWPNAAIQNLRYMWTGRNAWVGQASCTYSVGAPAVATREAWGTLALDQQRDANAVAMRVRTEWERDGVSQTLFAI